MRGFLADDAKRRPAPSSEARPTAALKSFLRFLLDDEQLERNPARPLRTPKKREALPDVLTMAELERLLAAPARATSGSGTSTASPSATDSCSQATMRFLDRSRIGFGRAALSWHGWRRPEGRLQPDSSIGYLQNFV